MASRANRKRRQREARGQRDVTVKVDGRELDGSFTRIIDPSPIDLAQAAQHMLAKEAMSTNPYFVRDEVRLVVEDGQRVARQMPMLCVRTFHGVIPIAEYDTLRLVAA